MTQVILTKEQIIEHLGMSELPAEMQDSLVAKIYQNAFDEAALKVGEKLDPKQLEEFDTIAEKETPAAALEWLVANTSYGELVRESVLDQVIKTKHSFNS